MHERLYIFLVTQHLSRLLQLSETVHSSLIAGAVLGQTAAESSAYLDEEISHVIEAVGLSIVDVMEELVLVGALTVLDLLGAWLRRALLGVEPLHHRLVIRKLLVAI